MIEFTCINFAIIIVMSLPLQLLLEIGFLHSNKQTKALRLTSCRILSNGYPNRSARGEQKWVLIELLKPLITIYIRGSYLLTYG